MVYCSSKQHRHRPKRTKLSNISSRHADPGCSKQPCSRAFRIYPTYPPPLRDTQWTHMEQQWQQPPKTLRVGTFANDAERHTPPEVSPLMSGRSGGEGHKVSGGGGMSFGIISKRAGPHHKNIPLHGCNYTSSFSPVCPCGFDAGAEFVSDCEEESTLAGGTSKGRPKERIRKSYCQGDGSPPGGNFAGGGGDFKGAGYPYSSCTTEQHSRHLQTERGRLKDRFPFSLASGLFSNVY